LPHRYFGSHGFSAIVSLASYTNTKTDSKPPYVVHLGSGTWKHASEKWVNRVIAVCILIVLALVAVVYFHIYRKRQTPNINIGFNSALRSRGDA
jgi:hypothetical protein